ncbi:MAG: helix-turn-helix transcriptional regulator [Deltaproteobacteria bacterium]|nr:helix-turn-helix transcriptional regulator [Deltaproteobacteria bacterium]
MTPLATFTVAGVELAVVPRAALAKLRGTELPPTKQELFAARLRAARERAGLTQAALAERLGVAQPTVCAAERGRERVGARYLANVLAACGLPENWTPRGSTRRRRKG